MRKLSSRTERITQSEIRAMTLACQRVQGINMAQGVCNLGVPEPVTRGVTQAMADGFNCYTKYSGLPELRQALAQKLADYNQLPVDPEQEIVVSAGATGAFYAAGLALLEPGDEVLVFEPYYGYHVSLLQALETVPKFVALQPPDWTFSLAQLEAAVSPRTRAMVVCTPGNPCGKVFTREELLQLGAFAERHDLLIFSDEIYEYFLYDGRTHVSPAALPGLRERTITISGYSKTFSITGWRIGYSVQDRRLTEAIGYMNDLVYVCAPAPLQIGVAAGIRELDASFYQGLLVEFAAKRSQICTTLEKAGLRPYVPHGAYYVLADVSRLPGRTSKERAMYLLAQTGVATVPGSAFYAGNGGDGLVRFCFAKSAAELDEACARLARLG
jgi:aminotransferase